VAYCSFCNLGTNKSILNTIYLVGKNMMEEKYYD